MCMVTLVSNGKKKRRIKKKNNQQLYRAYAISIVMLRFLFDDTLTQLLDKPHTHMFLNMCKPIYFIRIRKFIKIFQCFKK